jgi:hypothetical protein
MLQRGETAPRQLQHTSTASTWTCDNFASCTLETTPDLFARNPVPAMDIVQAVSGYITKMVSVGDSAATGTSAAKMKILLLDNETVGLSPVSKELWSCAKYSRSR